MLAKSSNSLHPHHIQHKSDVAHHVLTQLSDASGQLEKKKRQWTMVIWLPLWVTASFVVAQLLVSVALWVCDMLKFPLSTLMSASILETIVASVVYLLTLAIVVGVPYVMQQRTTDLSAIGLDRLLRWGDILLSPIGFIVYALLWSLVSYLVVQLIPHFPIDQAQEVGFKGLGHRYEYTLAFITLVVIAPFAEEVLFRGYLYGKLQKYVPVMPALIATSLLFGIAHLFAGNNLQWNVMLDTLTLSVVLCALRNITGSIWAGVLLHMLKNAVAFYAVFVAPALMMGG